MTSSDRILLTGNYETLEHAFIEEIRRLRKIDPLQPLIVVVISHLVALYLSRLLAEKQLDHINVRFYTLEDLALEITRHRRKTSGWRILPEFASKAVMGSVMKEISSRSYFKPVASFRGFSGVLLETIADLKDACLQPRQLRLAARKLNRSLGQKVSDLARIWNHYQTILTQQGWLDTQDITHFAIEGVPLWKELNDALRILIYGFYDFNPLQKSLIRSCITSKPTTVFFPYEKDIAYAYALPAKRWLCEQGLREITLKPEGSSSNDQIVHLSKNLFKSGKAFDGKSSDLKIVSAPGEASEAQETLRFLLNDCLTRGIPLSETAVLLRKTQPYSDLYSDLLSRLSLEPYLPQAKALSDTLAGRCTLLVLEILERDYPREKVIELAKSIERSIGAECGETSLWESITLKAGITGTKSEWLERLAKVNGKRTLSKPKRSTPAVNLQSFIKKLFKHLGNVEKAETWSAKAQALTDAVEWLLARTDHLEPEVRLGEVISEIKALAKLDGVGKPSTLEFALGVEDILSSSAVTRGRFGRTGPAVIGIMAARGLSFDAVVIPGLTDGYFPLHPKEDPILTDIERMEINRTVNGKETSPIVLKTINRLDEERLLFEIAISSARKALIVSYPRLDPYSVRERLPSPFLYAAIGALEGSKPMPENLVTSVNLVHIPLSRIAPPDPTHSFTRREFETSLATVSISEKRIGALLDFVGETTNLKTTLEAEFQRWGSKSLTAYDGLLVSSSARDKLAANHSLATRTISVTMLQDYALCPHYYFLKNILRIQPSPEPADLTRLDPRLRGELLHLILYTFFTEIARNRERPIRLRQSDWKLFVSIALRKFEEFENTHPTGYRMIWELQKSQILEQLEVIFEETLLDTSYLPAYFELTWGSRDDTCGESNVLEELTLEPGKRLVRLRGRIDRIDITADGRLARIIDYKTGKARTKHDDFDGGRNLQLPIYIIAGDAFFKAKGEKTKVDHAIYLHLLEKPNKRNVFFHALILKERWNHLMKILQTIADGIEKGHFFQYPDYHCWYCDYSQICGSSRFYLFQRKQNDKRLIEFSRLREEDFEDEATR